MLSKVEASKGRSTTSGQMGADLKRDQHENAVDLAYLLLIVPINGSPQQEKKWRKKR